MAIPLIEPTALDEFDIVVGFTHLPGAGYRIATVGGGDNHVRHLAPAAALRLGRELIEAEPALEPVAHLLQAKVERLRAWERSLFEYDPLNPVPALGAA
jgi:hypothetical protein